MECATGRVPVIVAVRVRHVSHADGEIIARRTRHAHEIGHAGIVAHYGRVPCDRGSRETYWYDACYVGGTLHHRGIRITWK